MDVSFPTPSKGRIIIGICTRNRPQDLTSCLLSLAEIDQPVGYEIECLIVENSSVASIAEVLASVSLPFPVTHVNEPHLGVVHARNRLFTETQSLGADWLVMIDDDEVAAPDWLVAYADAIQKFPNARFFCGPYVYPQPHGLSRWRRPPWTDDWVLGTHVDFAKTGNALFHCSIFASDDLGLRFDPRFNQTGGEDYDLSRRIIASGRPLIFVPDARIFELVKPERTSFRYGVHRVWRDRYTQQKYRYLHSSMLDVVRQDLADHWHLIKSMTRVSWRLIKSALRLKGRETRFLIWDLIFLSTQMATILTYPISRDFVAYGVEETLSNPQPSEDALSER